MPTDPTGPTPDDATNKWTLVAGGMVILGILTFAGVWAWERVERMKRGDFGGRPFSESKGRRLSFMERKFQRMATQHGLRHLGELYLRAVQKGSPPRAATDLKAVEKEDDEDVEYLSSVRTDEPFVIVWGVDPAQLPGGGAKMLLAWEASADDMGGRFVQMADCKTSTYVKDEEFERLPRATARAEKANDAGARN